MTVTPDKTFMYGDFKIPGSLPTSLTAMLLGGPTSPGIALEILREFSATEFVGKVYTKGRGGAWAPASQPGIREYDWYKSFQSKGLMFEVEGSAPWRVLYFRAESDESGPYVAVGLKLSENESA